MRLSAGIVRVTPDAQRASSPTRPSEPPEPRREYFSNRAQASGARSPPGRSRAQPDAALTVILACEGTQMEQLVIEGQVPLHGTVTPSGNKNSALPLLAACLLTDQPVVLHNVPEI